MVDKKTLSAYLKHGKDEEKKREKIYKKELKEEEERKRIRLEKVENNKQKLSKIELELHLLEMILFLLSDLLGNISFFSFWRKKLIAKDIKRVGDRIKKFNKRAEETRIKITIGSIRYGSVEKPEPFVPTADGLIQFVYNKKK